MRYPLHILLLIACITSTAALGQTKPPPRVDPTKYAIIGYNKAIGLTIFDKSDNPRTATLSRAEVDNMEILVDSAYRRFCNYSLAGNRSSPKPLSVYKRQYIAIVNGRGQKEVQINFFCDPPNDWRKNVSIVFDGGVCVLKLRINLTLRKAYDLIPNGVA
jgi:hypothetical protein